MTPTIVEKRKTIDDCGLAWWFYHYHFSIANDMNVYEYNLSMQEAVLAPPMVTRFDHIRTEYFFEYTNL
jgi:hypothetical protein